MAFILHVKVVPRSRRVRWVVDAAGRLKCYVKSPPEKGKANQELVELLANALGITQQQITIVAGATTRVKRVEIDADISDDDVLNALGFARQQRLFDD